VELIWTRKKQPGSEGMTHRSSVTLAGGSELVFTVDQPRKGFWVLRSWLDGDMVKYREYTTLSHAKEAAQDYADEAEPTVRAYAHSVMDRATALVAAARQRVQFRKDTCGCRSPLHTMRCGVGGVVVVASP
jgi:hypothetical protein